MRSNLPPTTLFLGVRLPEYPNHAIAEHIASGSNGHLFRAHNETTGSDLAFKVVPVSNLPRHASKRQAYLREARAPNLLDSDAVVTCHDVLEYTARGVDSDLLIFVFDYIDGLNLQQYVKRHRDAVTVVFVETFLRTMLTVFYEIKARDTYHGDLHDRNILVTTPKYDPYQRTRFVVTDFGIPRLTGQVAHQNDYLSLAIVLRTLLQAIVYADCSSRDRYAFNVLNDEFLGRHLPDTDSTRDPLAANPGALLRKLDSIEATYVAARRNPSNKLLSPFDYPNCEQIGNSHLLLKSLYSDRLLGLEEIQRRANLVLTGPRGCGKTTVFRALSLDYLLSTTEADPSAIAYIGVYYRCDDLYFAFPRYETPTRDEARDLPVHFLSSTLIASALDHVRVWALRHFVDELAREEYRIAASLCDLFGWDTADLGGNPRLQTIIALLRGRERKRAREKQRFASDSKQSFGRYFGPDLVFATCELLRSTFSFLRDRPFYFFVDDYSHPKITEDLQKSLNRMLFHRSPDVFFKVSTESPVSYWSQDSDEKRYIESREYDLLNLGLRYIGSDPVHTQTFLEDLFRRRFGEVPSYPVTALGELIGSRPRNENETARLFRARRSAGVYSGVEAVTAMCSGDVHYMIRLVGRMVDDFGGSDALATTTADPKIPAKSQHASIRAAAGDFMDSVRSLPRWGARLEEVVSAFGRVAHSFLRHANSKNETGEPPHQASRIEPYEPLRITPAANTVLNELLRYSILIEDPRGMSRRGKVVRRFFLRRYLIPHFRLTFSRRDSLQLENAEIEMLLTDPKSFEARMTLKSSRDASRRGKRNDSRPTLFFTPSAENGGSGDASGPATPET